MGVQIKAGDSHLGKGGKKVYLKSDKEHFEYWHSHILPIIGIVYIPGEGKGFWIDITEYLESNKEIIETGPYNILIQRENELSIDKFELLHLYLKKYLDKYSQYWNFGKSLSQFVDDHKLEERVEAIKSLFYHHRNRKETWFYLIRQFEIERNVIIQMRLIQMYSYLEGHGDTFWHKGNIIDQEISVYGKNLIKKMFGIRELKILLQNIDENGISRGSIGQDIHVLIDLIPNKIDNLKKIILEETADDDSRAYAGLLAIYDFQRYDLERAINFAQSMVTNFPNSKYKFQFETVKEILEEYGEFNFYG